MAKYNFNIIKWYSKRPTIEMIYNYNEKEIEIRNNNNNEIICFNNKMDKYKIHYMILKMIFLKTIIKSHIEKLKVINEENI